jgi:hypothetical protein
MAGWEEELAMLLHELEVTQEEPRTHLQPTRKRGRSDVKWREQAVDDLFWHGDNAEDDDAWLDDLFLMRLEVESIVSQVIRLMQRGDLDKSYKEDVMVVLHALRRRAMVAQQAAASEEAHSESEFAYLEFSTAMLHFCRLVLRLSESAIEDL